ncbi:hypothetical protein NSTC745_05994 [Nostoc sp. DSM 114161]|jgi:hypothetical protein|uniref:hypothetical protein n=1 Tax=Nostoc sp. DSM 114161 TaxID=3440143 RepID=UPI00404593AA
MNTIAPNTINIPSYTPEFQQIFIAKNYTFVARFIEFIKKQYKLDKGQSFLKVFNQAMANYPLKEMV